MYLQKRAGFVYDLNYADSKRGGNKTHKIAQLTAKMSLGYHASMVVQAVI